MCVWCSSSGTETNETRNQTTEWFKSYLVAFIAIIINPDLNIMQSILVVLDIYGRYNIKTESETSFAVGFSCSKVVPGSSTLTQLFYGKKCFRFNGWISCFQVRGQIFSPFLKMNLM